jgi:hypothetical protein
VHSGLVRDPGGPAGVIDKDYLLVRPVCDDDRTGFGGWAGVEPLLRR